MIRVFSFLFFVLFVGYSVGADVNCTSSETPNNYVDTGAWINSGVWTFSEGATFGNGSSGVFLGFVQTTAAFGLYSNQEHGPAPLVTVTLELSMPLTTKNSSVSAQFLVAARGSNPSSNPVGAFFLASNGTRRASFEDRPNNNNYTFIVDGTEMDTGLPKDTSSLSVVEFLFGDDEVHLFVNSQFIAQLTTTSPLSIDEVSFENTGLGNNADVFFTDVVVCKAEEMMDATTGMDQGTTGMDQGTTGMDNNSTSTNDTTTGIDQGTTGMDNNSTATDGATTGDIDTTTGDEDTTTGSSTDDDSDQDDEDADDDSSSLKQLSILCLLPAVFLCVI